MATTLRAITSIALPLTATVACASSRGLVDEPRGRGSDVAAALAPEGCAAPAVSACGAAPVNAGREHWSYVDDATGGRLSGSVEYVACEDGGRGAVYYGGPAQWLARDAEWSQGFWFDVIEGAAAGDGLLAQVGRSGGKGHLVVRRLEGGIPGAIVFEKTGVLSGGAASPALEGGHP